MAFVQVLPRRLVRWIAAEPGWDPDNAQVIETAVLGERVVRVIADDRQRLQQVMDALGINDRAVPFDTLSGEIDSGVMQTLTATGRRAPSAWPSCPRPTSPA